MALAVRLIGFDYSNESFHCDISSRVFSILEVVLDVDVTHTRIQTTN